MNNPQQILMAMRSSAADASRTFLQPLFWAVLLLAGQQASAETVFAEGRSPVGSDLQAARSQAYEEAVRNAWVKAGGGVDSSSALNNGVASSDLVNLRIPGKFRDVEVLDEIQLNGFYVVTVRAEVDEDSDCKATRSAEYHKDVLFTGFPRERPEMAQAGRLDNVDAEFSLALSQRLYSDSHVLVHNEPSVLLAGRTQYGDAGMQVSEAVKKLAARYQVQFVVSGSIVDMSMLYPHSYFRQDSLFSALRKFSGMSAARDREAVEKDVRTRRFAFRVVMYDGVTGVPVFDKTYGDMGIWDARYTEATGFASPRFWNTHYGQVVNGLMSKAVDELGQKINCQPFMVPVKPGGESGQSLYVQAGANHGVRVGDSLELGQLRGEYLPGSDHVSDLWPYPAEQRSLAGDGVTVTITQVYPNYSIGKPSSYLHNGHRYMAIAW